MPTTINQDSYFAPALTELQSELTAKIGSMKSLLALPKIKALKIPKDQQISAVDYLFKVLDVLGIDGKEVLNRFLFQVLDEQSEKLEKFTLEAIANSFAVSRIQLSPYVFNSAATQSEVAFYKEENYKYLDNLFPNTFLDLAKQKMVNKLMIMIFGPKEGPVAEALVPDLAEREVLVSNAVCGIGMFAISNDPQIKDSDVEYTRIKRRQELEKGQVVYEISCQDVKITLPADPNIIFQGGGVNTQAQQLPLTPFQSIQWVNEYVVSQVQKINNEKNAQKGGKTFLRILVDSIITFMTSLIQPLLPSVFTTIENAINSNNNLSTPASLPSTGFVFDLCQINNLENSSVPEDEKNRRKEFIRSLLNSLLKDLIKLLLAYTIKRLKKFLKAYFAKSAEEKMKRRADRLKRKYEAVLRFQQKLNKNLAKIEEAKKKIETYNAAVDALSSLINKAI